MGTRRDKKHFNDEGIVIFSETNGNECFVGAIADYRTQEGFIDAIQEEYGVRLNIDDIQMTYVAWRADYIFGVKFGMPCGWKLKKVQGVLSLAGR